MSTVLSQAQLQPDEFAAISALLYQVCGISMHDGKQGLVQTRLAKRLARLGLTSYAAYLEHVRGDTSGEELSLMVDLLTTNKTDFFRENQHFQFLKSHVLPEHPQGGVGLRIWSAACSSGEEPYTIAMVLREALSDASQTRILATDISSQVLAKAREGVYTAAVLEPVDATLRKKYFTRVPGQADAYRVNPSLQQMIRFARLNLMASWPMRGPFDVIFCRNVMIYFDRPTQERLVQRFWELLPAGGYLFTGHSESLNSLAHRFRYIQPAVYRK